MRDGHYTLRAGSEPRVFSQVNDAIAQTLRNLIVDLVPPNQDLLIDAYCGAGFFAKALLDKFERVIGIDWDKFAIAAAKENATDKETYIAADVEEELTRKDGFLTVEVGRQRLGKPSLPDAHRRSIRYRTERKCAKSDCRFRADNAHLRFMQSADARARFKRFAGQIHHRFGHAARHVPTNCGD